jgi:hypothetical protein
MISGLFDLESFKMFLGDPVSDNRTWGRVKRYVVDRERLRAYEHQIRGTFLHHHSSFDFDQEIIDVGFPQTAQILRKRRAELPNHHETQMGHFAEVLGSEYGRWALGFDTTFVLPKHFGSSLKRVQTVDNDK